VKRFICVRNNDEKALVVGFFKSFFRQFFEEIVFEYQTELSQQLRIDVFAFKDVINICTLT